MKSIAVRKVPIVIGVVSLFALIYQLAPYIGIPETAILAMFIISPFLIIYMAYVILKYGKPSGHTFDERFYDDVEP